MEKCKNNSPKSECYDDLDDFLFIADDEDLDLKSEEFSLSENSKTVELTQKVIVQAVISALTAVTSKESTYGIAITKTILTGAASTITAGAVGGLPGVVLGVAIAGGVLAYKALRKKTLTDVIKSLSPRHQRQLITHLTRGLQGLGIKDLATDILNRKDVTELAITILSKFLTQKYGLKITRIDKN